MEPKATTRPYYPTTCAEPICLGGPKAIWDLHHFCLVSINLPGRSELLTSLRQQQPILVICPQCFNPPTEQEEKGELQTTEGREVRKKPNTYANRSHHLHLSSAPQNPAAGFLLQESKINEQTNGLRINLKS